MKLRVIIVDDERLARRRVRTLLGSEAEVEVLGECEDGEKAVAAIEAGRPDLVFLDVQMPRMDGFEVVEALGTGAMPALVFTTAHDEHAIRAFEVNALDYLLKPFSEARFRAAMARARERLSVAAGERVKTGEDRQIAALVDHWRRCHGGGPRILVKTPQRIFFFAGGAD